MKPFGKLVLWLIFVIVVGQWLFSLGKILFYGGLFDFGYYLRAVENLQNNINPYFAENFTYPPPALFLFIPFSKLPLFWSQIAWTSLSLLCLFFALKYIFVILSGALPPKNLLMIIPLILLSFPVRWTFGLGQINFLVLLFLVLTYYFSIKNKNIRSGICLGLAVLLKMTPLFLVLYFLIKKKFKIVIFSLLTISLLLVLSGICFGFNLTKDYVMVVVPKLFEPSSKHGYYNQAFSSLSAGFISNINILTIINLLFALIIVIADFYVFINVKTVNTLDYGLAMCSMLLINGFSWQHHFSLLIFPYLAAFSYVYRKEWWIVEEKSKIKNQKFINNVAVSYLPLAISYIMVSYNFKRPELLGTSFFANILLSHVFWGILLLWGVLFYAILSSRPSQALPDAGRDLFEPRTKRFLPAKRGSE